MRLLSWGSTTAHHVVCRSEVHINNEHISTYTIKTLCYLKYRVYAVYIDVYCFLHIQLSQGTQDGRKVENQIYPVLYHCTLKLSSVQDI